MIAIHDIDLDIDPDLDTDLDSDLDLDTDQTGDCMEAPETTANPNNNGKTTSTNETPNANDGYDDY